MPVILPGQLQTPAPPSAPSLSSGQVSSLAQVPRPPRPDSPLTQGSGRSLGLRPRLHPFVPFLTSWSCPSPAPPRSHRPVENMPRVKSTQAPESSESATPPASIPPALPPALGALRLGAGRLASWVPGRNVRAPPPGVPAPPRVLGRPPETEPEPGRGRPRQAGTPAAAPGPPPARTVPGPDDAFPVSVGPLPGAPHSLLTPWVT